MILSGEFRGREGFPYAPHPDLITAANIALMMHMPLLLTGEPGCGKTDFAFAVAHALGAGPPLESYVRSETRAKDLLYSYEAMCRFGDAQNGREPEKEQARYPHPYLELRELGEALLSSALRVVLIDEIDKAPRDLPNDLLLVLEQGRFEVSEIGDGPPPPKEVRWDRRLARKLTGVSKPLVIITSNEERQLPDPFLRRCVFFHIEQPGGEQLREIVRGHFPKEPMLQDGELLQAVVAVFERLRALKPALTKRPSTSELLCWAGAIKHMGWSSVREDLRLFGNQALDSRALPWRALRGLGCLLKLREDWERVVALDARR